MLPPFHQLRFHCVFLQTPFLRTRFRFVVPFQSVRFRAPTRANKNEQAVQRIVRKLSDQAVRAAHFPLCRADRAAVRSQLRMFSHPTALVSGELRIQMYR